MKLQLVSRKNKFPVDGEGKENASTVGMWKAGDRVCVVYFEDLKADADREVRFVHFQVVRSPSPGKAGERAFPKVYGSSVAVCD